MLARQPFHIDEPLVVRRHFDGFRPGDPFDWKARGINVRRVATLFRSGYLAHGVAEREPEPVAAEPVAAEPEQTTTGVEFVRNGPWYNVVCGGVVLNTDGAFKGLKAAQEWAEANGIK
jgi:hypothetical protein